MPTMSQVGVESGLQGLADEFGLIITVTHYPTGASKWNPIDHRMFSLISGNWSGEPLISYETILGYIRGTRSSKGSIAVPVWIRPTIRRSTG